MDAKFHPRLQVRLHPGVVGFGVDVLGLYSIKLDGGKGTAGTQLLPVHDDGRPADDFGRTALAGKMRVSKTELKVGEWSPTLPILRADDGRSLPQTLQGAQVTSNELAGLSLYGGQFRQNSPRNDASMQDMSLFTRTAFTSDRFNFAGGEYRFNQERTLVGAWYASWKTSTSSATSRCSINSRWATGYWAPT